MILYQYPGGDGLSTISPPCLKVDLALHYVGAEYRVEYCRMPRDVKRISPTGRLPVLEVDGMRIADSAAILDEIERRFPEPALRPDSAPARAVDRLWEHFATDTMYWQGFYMRWVHAAGSRRFTGALLKKAPAPLRFAINTFFVPRQVRRARLVGHVGRGDAAVLVDIERSFRTVSDGLQGGPFLQGRDRPGRGDFGCAAMLAQIGFRDALPEVMARVREHPALVEHATRVFEACGVDPPRWIQRGAWQSIS